ncbi:hypothetical protein Ciccas_012803 [Cichlidogyrus casuarinus]|uniref:DUF1311 domain-containing protein n=1 Tax=Cichlidogyrus casuarinus TaxID=1844966 RepID=A0ABD2PSD8_9PLAT
MKLLSATILLFSALLIDNGHCASMAVEYNCGINPMEQIYSRLSDIPEEEKLNIVNRIIELTKERHPEKYEKLMKSEEAWHKCRRAVNGDF